MMDDDDLENLEAFASAVTPKVNTGNLKHNIGPANGMTELRAGHLRQPKWKKQLRALQCGKKRWSKTS